MNPNKPLIDRILGGMCSGLVAGGVLAGIAGIAALTQRSTTLQFGSVKLAGVVYILHVFRKKSTRGIAMPKHVLATIRARWHQAKVHHAAHYGAGARHHDEA